MRKYLFTSSDCRKIVALLQKIKYIFLAEKVKKNNNLEITKVFCLQRLVQRLTYRTLYIKSSFHSYRNVKELLSKALNEKQFTC